MTPEERTRRAALTSATRAHRALVATRAREAEAARRLRVAWFVANRAGTSYHGLAAAFGVSEAWINGQIAEVRHDLVDPDHHTRATTRALVREFAARAGMDADEILQTCG